MFNKPGAQIKSIAKIFFWIQTIGGIIAGIVLSIAYEDLLPALIGIFAFVPAYFVSLLLYGFGSLIEDTQANREINNDILFKIEHKTEENNTKSSPVKPIKAPPQKTWLCECGNSVIISATECPKCNKKRPAVLDKMV